MPSVTSTTARGTSLLPLEDLNLQLPELRIERRPLLNGAWKPGQGSAMSTRGGSSLQSLASSRSMLEQRLNEHQRTLAAQQQAALQEIGNALCGNGTSVVLNENDHELLCQSNASNNERLVAEPLSNGAALFTDASVHGSSLSSPYLSETPYLFSEKLNTGASLTQSDHVIISDTNQIDSETAVPLQREKVNEPDNITSYSSFKTSASSAVDAGRTTPSSHLFAVVGPSVQPPVVDGVFVANLMAQRTPADVLAANTDEIPSQECHQMFVERVVVHMMQMTGNDQRVETTVVSPDVTQTAQVTRSAMKAAYDLLASDVKLETNPQLVINSETSPGVKTPTGQSYVVLCKSDRLEHSITAVPLVDVPSTISAARHDEPVPRDSPTVSWSFSDNKRSSLVKPGNVQPLPKGILKKRPSSVPVSSYNAVVSSTQPGSGGLARLGATTSSDSSSCRGITNRNLLLSRLLSQQTTAEVCLDHHCHLLVFLRCVISVTCVACVLGPQRVEQRTSSHATH